MAKDSYEKDFDDEVYEDNYYEEHYEDEELYDDGESEEEKLRGEDKLEEDATEEEWDVEKKVVLSFACEDCDYRWEDVVLKRKDVLVDLDVDIDAACPMCGSMNTSQI